MSKRELLISSEDFVIAGFYPDNGGSHFLNKLRGQLGMYLALTCKRLRGEEAFVSGLATHYVTVADGSVSKFFIV